MSDLLQRGRDMPASREINMRDFMQKTIDTLADENALLQAKVAELEAALDRVDYALENIWAIDRDRLRELIAEALANSEVKK